LAGQRRYPRQRHPCPSGSVMPDTPWLFRIQLEHTPSLNDPKGSRDFYEALGLLVVAWGRLEGHFLACVLAILATPATQALGKKMPLAWDKRKMIWSKAFRLVAVRDSRRTPHGS
jgi:hypothetical protein